MKKFLSLLFIGVIPGVTYADSGISSVTWNNNTVDCATTVSHGVTHEGIPDTNIGIIATSGTTSCTTHTYYSADDHNIGVTGNNGSITACPAGERAVAISPNPCTGGACTMTCRKYDDTRPVATDITTSTTLNLLATTSQSFSATVGTAGGGPITSVSAFFENYASPGSYLGFQTSPSNLWTFNEDIRYVDNNRGANGGRPYSLRIAKICDQAQNCTCSSAAGLAGYCASPLTAPNVLSPIHTFAYNVYANPNVMGTNSSTYTTNNIADGQPSTFTQTIADQWNNAIIPASGISRTVSENLTGISNTMYLDQYTLTPPTSVFVTPTTGTEVGLATASPQNLGNQNSTNGSYPLIIKVYTPTANSYLPTDPISDPNAAFGFNSRLTVADTLIGPPKSFSQPLPTASFKPLYTSSISGDLRNGGFIEGAYQNNTISITNNNAGVSPTSNSLQLEFGGSDAPKFTLQGNSTVNPTTVIGTRATMIVNPMSPILGSTPLYSFLKQNPGLVGNLSNLYLSTHFSYTLGGHNVIYNSDIIGKTQYHTGSTGNIGTQYGVKILGAVSSNVAQALTVGQFATTTSLFSGVNRATIRNNINKSITISTRNLVMNNTINSPILTSISTPPSAGAGGSGGIITQSANSSIMKLSQAGGNITLGNGADFVISGKRTLIIVGANLYIKSNMYYQNKDAILGVVLLKDKNGNGGNLYIDSSITNIVGSYVMDGSVQSHDGTSVLGISNISALKNQLYIYGSIVSENTIGGSRMSTPQCPSLLSIPPASCTLGVAQTYDLNFLRRYYLYNNEPFGNGKVTGGETCPLGTCTNTNTNLVQKFTNTTADLAKYPIIIERNPNVITNPPPGLDTQVE